MADAAGTRNSKKAKDDMVKESQAAIRGPETAKKWITDNELAIKGECLTTGTLTTALFQLCSGKFTQTKEMISGIRAIALCFEELNQTRYTSEALDTVKEQVEKVVKGAKEAIEDLAEGMKSVMKEAEGNYRKHKEVRGTDEVERIIEKAVQTATKPSYAQALANGSDSRTESRDRQIKNDVKVRGQLQRRQIILDGNEATKEQTSQLTPKVLIEKANLALDKLEKRMDEALQEDDNERPKDAKFVAARILKNGGILFEMSFETAVEWLKQKEITKAFEGCFPGAISVKGRTYQVVVQFLSVRLKNCLEELNTEIEEENNLPKDSIASIKWLRNPDNWGANQSKAHAILTLKSRRNANDIIMGGILINGSQYDTRKLEEDPKHCYKCQLVGVSHMAASCKAEEACSNCTRQHPTGDCRAL